MSASELNIVFSQRLIKHSHIQLDPSNITVVEDKFSGSNNPTENVVRNYAKKQYENVSRASGSFQSTGELSSSETVTLQLGRFLL